jgi:CHAD domain-containing protein
LCVPALGLLRHERRRPQVHSHAANPAALHSTLSLPDCEAAFQRIAKRCVKLIQDQRKAAIAADPEAIHTMRIELTRLRAAVLFFSPATDDDAWPKIDRELRWLNSALGKARDHDVTANYARRKRYRRWAKSSRQALLHAQRKVDRRLSKMLASARYEHLMRTVDHWITDGPWLLTDRSVRSEQADTYARARLHAWRAAISREGRHLRILHRKQLHRLRIQCKRYRYVVAALRCLGVPLARQDLKFSEIAKRVHGALGDLRDLKRLRRVAQKRPPGYRKSKRKFIQMAEKPFRSSS